MAELRRPENGKVIAGVCAAIADRFGITRSVVRAIAVVSCLLPGPQFVLYNILWIAIPAEGITAVSEKPKSSPAS
jgi:phage shock protein PspC (stress-responsive transcriptional regulator)